MIDKYVVFKVADWDTFVSKYQLKSELAWHVSINPSTVLEDLPEAVPDAEVIRHQDYVASGVLYAASGIYRSALELVGDTLTKDQREYIEGVASHFYEAAEKAASLPGHKLPD